MRRVPWESLNSRGTSKWKLQNVKVKSLRKSQTKTSIDALSHFAFFNCILPFALKLSAVLTKSQKDFIRTARVAHLATADAKRQPLVIPICFVFDGKEFFSPIDEKPKRLAPQKLRRLQNIEQNSRVSLVIAWHSRMECGPK